MPSMTPQPHHDLADPLPRPAKPDYRNVFIEPVYGNGFPEDDLEDDPDEPATSRAEY
ncbi:hypothetical protein SAMN05428945_5892 [Streptomyces sp. 2224.1]|uniref:hypothetical protein n=1 Tax=unclassified Streptomyces TaxID=2593676 RepID=UPI0008860853|nr:MULTISPECIES: hypothetical protein [unclassified Streptomyces]PBC86563.1 hypothetical protein BX261_6659 [Streptomyces sp. 2321.6]SDQ80066.1 hypothetical protein SAMN05216511_0591 [Streptomyces sp. KS_16]SED58820.1 hypothetical protein SAMN05428954_0574 [Streptomyces sp. 2112.3]SED88207.1 hypothetical protein SAMN05428945_5892 [Streptomyces sp. 2224.1]SEE02407.1 hypothetical protein SAMN05428940_6686 [Streptomyces sp. 2133.1]